MNNAMLKTKVYFIFVLLLVGPGVIIRMPLSYYEKHDLDSYALFLCKICPFIDLSRIIAPSDYFAHASKACLDPQRALHSIHLMNWLFIYSTYMAIGAIIGIFILYAMRNHFLVLKDTPLTQRRFKERNSIFSSLFLSFAAFGFLHLELTAFPAEMFPQAGIVNRPHPYIAILLVSAFLYCVGSCARVCILLFSGHYDALKRK